MIIKIYTKNEVYIYMNGSLLYKRWLDQGYGKVFCTLWGQYLI